MNVGAYTKDSYSDCREMADLSFLSVIFFKSGL